MDSAQTSVLLAAAATTVIAFKWLEAPTLDGQCTDPAYDQSESIILAGVTGAPGPVAKVVHSGLDIYFCLSNMPGRSGEQVAVQVDSDYSRGELPQPGDYQFIVNTAGEIKMGKGDGAGAFSDIPLEGFAAALSTPSVGEWNAELRMSLEWFGGYARTDGLSVRFLQSGGGFAWPGSSSAGAPITWGDLVLAPLYPNSTTAGSAFVDGMGGYLVVPYAPALNPKEITIEAWVRVLDGDCGTVVGNDQMQSYWLALCGVIRFGHGNPLALRSGQALISDGWHHVAVTMDEDGQRAFYLDGQLDNLPGWEPTQEPTNAEVPAALGASDRMLRIGSDHSAGEEERSLHGYIHDLRIWNLARTGKQIHDAAFTPPSPTEPGLVAMWPFASSLQDVVGGHDAGLIGNASLARQTPDATTFPEPPKPEPYTYPAPQPLPAWNASIPQQGGAITVDGVCGLSEYAAASQLRMEPNRALFMDVLLANDALYLCTNILFGRISPNDGVTMFINRDGKGGASFGPADLRLRLTPDGHVAITDGMGARASDAPALIETKVISDSRFDIQEDIRPVAAPWWAGELRIPLSMLAPFTPGQTLRMAVRYDGTIPDPPPVDLPWDQLLHGSWPASFSESVPATWGGVTSTVSLYLPVVMAPGGSAAQIASSEMSSLQPLPNRATPIVLDESLLLRSGPRQTAGPIASPTSGDFDKACPGWKTPAYAFSSADKWPMVDPANHPVVRGEGKLTDLEVSKEDSPFIHNSHDVDMFVNPDAASAWIKLAGAASQVLETESGGFAAYARPVVDDHITAIGRWIFDCGHAAKTEIHPTPIFESDREAVRPVQPGKEMQTVRVMRVWMNSSPGAFNYLFTGSYSFSVQLPSSGGAHPFFSVNQGDASRIGVVVNGSTATVTVTPPASTGNWYWEIVIGRTNPVLYAPGNKVFTVHLDKIDVIDDHDHGFPDCGFASDCGEWFMTANINGVGKQIFWNKTTDDGESYTLNIPFTVVGGNLILSVEGHDNDDPVAGDSITHVTGANLGSLSGLCCNTTRTYQPGSDYKLYYRVTQDGSVPISLQDSAFWNPRQSEEANDGIYQATNLGTLTVPAQGVAAQTTNHAAFISERTLFHTNATLLGSDVDRYRFTLADFANVTIGSVPAGLTRQIESQDPWYWNIPANIEALIGYKGARINVHRNEDQIRPGS